MEKEYPLQQYLVELRRIEAHRTKGAEQKIRLIYQALLKELRGLLGTEYAQYGTGDALTYGDLQRAGTYARFLEEVEARLSGLSLQMSREINEIVEQAYTASYTGMTQAVQEAVKTSAPLSATLAGVKGVTPEIVRRAVENPVAGLTLKDTLERNRKEIIYGIKRSIGVGLTQGDSYTTMARRISASLDGDYKKSIRIVRTEAHRVVEAGHVDVAVGINEEFKECGLQMVKTWKTMKDERVRPQQGRRKKQSKGGGKKQSRRRGKGNADHEQMEGVSIPADEAFDLGHGITALAPGQSGNAANDINCRCYLSYAVKEITPEGVHEIG